MAPLTRRTARIINAVSYQAGWFACVAGAGNGLPLLGPVVVALLLAVHLWLVPRRWHTLRGLAVISAIGIGVDSALAGMAVFSFPEYFVFPWLCPAWLIALWVIFASALESCLRWLVEWPRLAAAIGALFGPASYYAGQRLGALQFSPPLLDSLLILAIVWSALLPVLLWLSRKMVND